MAMATLKFLFLVLLLIISTLSRASSEDTPTAYEMLEKFNFPKGILPEGVQGYLLHPDGHFEVVLETDCDFKVEGGYLLKYGKKISGKVKSGSLTELKGVSVRVLFVWFNINEVDRADANLNFYVGPLSASFPLDNFEECPQCRCGFDCKAAALASDS